MPSPDSAWLEMRGIVKTFPGVRALRGVDLDVRPGEVHVLLGENGAGKSTLIKVLSGVFPPDAGAVRIGGAPARFARPDDAMAAGIRTIYQELSLIDRLTVAENLFLTRPPVGRLRHLATARLVALARRALEQIAPDVRPDAVVARLSLAQRQRVEIARALLSEGRLLIMDEPTASLNASESGRLFDLVRELRRRGTSVLYITHRLEEIEAIGDRVTVLRDGERVGCVPVRGTSLGTLIHMMVGDAPAAAPPAEARRGRTLLEVRGLSRRGAFSDVSLTVEAGEIVGIAGLAGSGATELARTLFGAEPAETGSIAIDGRQVALRSPREAIAAGIGYMPEDRAGQGLVPEAGVLPNVSLPSLRRFARWGWLRFVPERREVGDLIRRLRVVTPSLDQTVRLLSGGNQQKVIIARWLASRAHLLILNEPTRGVDVAARQEIYRVLEALAAEGRGILLLSSDLQEIVSVCHRAIVLRRGVVAGEVPQADLSKDRVLALAVGRS